ncbi:MAG: SAM-dependent methyltransferase, partial [Halobacteria archaeon]|nr:SAM-dependent methyltransferase [Halobacteria archaeon]
MTSKSKCVRVPREKGEETRQRLMELDALDHSLRIKSAEGYLYIPIVEGAEIPSEFAEEFADGLEILEDEFEHADTLDAPADILGYEPSFEVVGDMALIEYDDAGTRREVADALVEADNNVVGVLNVESKVKGEERTREMRHIAGEEKTEVLHREYGSEFLLDLTDVYFSPRLANERQRVVSQVEEGETVFDMFAGVGPF